MADLLAKITIYVASGGASTDIKDMKNIVDRTKEAMKAAEMSSEFLGILPNARIKFGEISEKLNGISESLGKLEKSVNGGRDIYHIYQAIKVLKNDRIFIEDPQKAAAAFDMLFKSFGGLCQYLPPPANEYGQFLKNFNLIGKFQQTISERTKTLDSITGGR